MSQLTQPWLLLTVILGLAVGTFAFRYAGPTLRGRVALSPRHEQLITAASIVLLTALVATQALVEGEGFAGWARTIGVAVGGAFAWLRAPFLVVVLAASATAAGLRLVGVP